MVELIWDGKYDTNGKRTAHKHAVASFSTGESDTYAPM